MKAHQAFLLGSNPVLILDLKRLMKRCGFQDHLIFSSIDKAWKYIQKYPPDVLVWDVKQKERKDGIDWIHRIRTHYSFPIMVLSTWPTDDVWSSIQHLECTKILHKPFPDWEFVEIMYSLDHNGYNENSGRRG